MHTGRRHESSRSLLRDLEDEDREGQLALRIVPVAKDEPEGGLLAVRDLAHEVRVLGDERGTSSGAAPVPRSERSVPATTESERRALGLAASGPPWNSRYDVAMTRHDDRQAASEKPPARDAAALMTRLQRTFDAETAEAWLDGLNPFLGGRRPRDVLASGDAIAVMAALDAEETGAYA